MSGKFISFEGIDGSGKSTQLRLLASDLRVRGLDVLTTLEPGGTPLGRRLRQTFLETEETVAPMAELLLFAADRAQHVEFLIKPALENGRIVISDRFADATAAYQGAGRGFDKRTIKKVIELATCGLKPDLTIFFDLPISAALLRKNARSSEGEKKNRMDSETNEFYGRVREAYLRIAEVEKERFKIIDASGSINDIHKIVLQLVLNFLDEK